MASQDFGLFLQAMQNANESVRQIAGLKRQQEQDAMKKQLLDLQRQEQKMRLDALTLEQNKMKARESFRTAFFEKLQNPQAPIEPLEPVGLEAGSPRGSSLDANALREEVGRAPVSDQERALQLSTMAAQAGEIPLLNSLMQQGFVSSPSGDLQRRAQEASVGLQEAQLGDVEALQSSRQVFFDALTKYGATLTGIDKQRVNLAAEAMKTAGPEQMASTAKWLFPTLEEPTSAFQALSRKFGDPIKALKVMGQIQVENAKQIAAVGQKPERIMGDDREAIAASMFDGKSFLQLTPEQMKTVNERHFKNKIRLQQEQMTGGVLPPDARKDIGELRVLSDMSKEVMASFKPEFVGKFTFVRNKIKILRGHENDKELIAFRALHSNLFDMVARDRTGAVIGKGEQKNFMKFLGSPFDQPGTFTARLNQFIDTVGRQEDVIFNLATTTVEELRKQRESRGQPKQNQNAARLEELSKKTEAEMTDAELWEFKRLQGK